MCVSATVVRELRKMGHDAVHLEELGLRTLPDADIFRMGQEEGRIVLTFDLDFADIAAATKASSPSTAALEKGAFVVADEARIRIRTLPIDDRG
jgi:predicted nuclease of predicted toxin-antitoxin system